MCREPDNQPTLGSFNQISGTGTGTTFTTVSCVPPEVSNHVNMEAPSNSETVQVTPNFQKTDVTLSSVDYNMDTANSGGELLTFKSAQLEVKDMGAINKISDSLGLVTEEGVEIQDIMILQHIPKNGHVDFEGDEQGTSNVVREETTDAVMGTEKSLPNIDVGDDLLSSKPSEVDSEKVDKFHVATEAQITPPSIGSHSAQACQATEESAVATGALQCETTEEGVDGESEINEVDELQVERADAAKALEMKMVEVIMRSPELEAAESRLDETLNPSSDYPLNVCEQDDDNRGKDVMNGPSEDEKFSELFQPVVQLPEHSGVANGFVGGTFDVGDLSNGQVSDDLRHANTQLLHRNRLDDTRSSQVTTSKGYDYTQQSGSDKGDGSIDRQDSGIATPSAATSAQSQSSGLKVSARIHDVLICCLL